MGFANFWIIEHLSFRVAFLKQDNLRSRLGRNEFEVAPVDQGRTKEAKWIREREEGFKEISVDPSSGNAHFKKFFCFSMPIDFEGFNWIILDTQGKSGW